MIDYRRNSGFTIIRSARISSNEEIVIGYNPTYEDHKFVTWFCRNGNDYNYGHYVSTLTEAVKDFLKRIKESN